MTRIAYIRAFDEAARKQQIDTLAPISDVRVIDTTTEALGLPRIIEQLNEGDVILITSMDRLGRRFGELIIGVLELATIEIHGKDNTLIIDEETWSAVGECAVRSSMEDVAATLNLKKAKETC